MTYSRFLSIIRSVYLKAFIERYYLELFSSHQEQHSTLLLRSHIDYMVIMYVLKQGLLPKFDSTDLPTIEKLAEEYSGRRPLGGYHRRQLDEIAKEIVDEIVASSWRTTLV